MRKEVKVAVPATDREEDVETGKHILTGEPIVKRRAKQQVNDWKTKDRQEFTVNKSTTGSLNGRGFDLKAGEKVHLNEDEFHLFKTYLEVE